MTEPEQVSPSSQHPRLVAVTAKFDFWQRLRATEWFSEENPHATLKQKASLLFAPFLCPVVSAINGFYLGNMMAHPALRATQTLRFGRVPTYLMTSLTALTATYAFTYVLCSQKLMFNFDLIYRESKFPDPELTKLQFAGCLIGGYSSPLLLAPLLTAPTKRLSFGQRLKSIISRTFRPLFLYFRHFRCWVLVMLLFSYSMGTVQLIGQTQREILECCEDVDEQLTPAIEEAVLDAKCTK